MKRGIKSSPALNAYNEGFRRGMDFALEDKELNIKQLNPYSPFLNRLCWEGFQNGATDGFHQGIRQREQHRAYVRLKELDKIRKHTPEKER